MSNIKLSSLVNLGIQYFFNNWSHCSYSSAVHSPRKHNTKEESAKNCSRLLFMLLLIEITLLHLDRNIKPTVVPLLFRCAKLFRAIIDSTYMGFIRSSNLKRKKYF